LLIFKNKATVHIGTAATAHVLNWLLAGLEAIMIPEALAANQKGSFFQFFLVLSQ
jgi:hypothetical protein